jgi:hypothetical protein
VSTETCRDPHDLAILAIEAMVAKCLARVAFTLAAVYPGHPRAASRPLDEGINARRQCRSASIRAVVDDESARQ